MKRVRQFELYSPDVAATNNRSKAIAPLENYTERDIKDRQILIDWIITEQKLPLGIAKVCALLCFNGQSHAVRPQIRNYFEKIRTDSKGDFSLKRREIVKWMTQSKPAYMMTVALPRPFSDQYAFDVIELFLDLVNAQLYGKRWTRDRKCGLKGIMVAEPHMQSDSKKGRLHFHILIESDEEIIDSEFLQDMAWKASIFLKDRKGRQILTSTLVHVERVDEAFGLACYLTKSLVFDDFASGDFIIPFSPSGIAFPRPRTAKQLVAWQSSRSHV